MSESLAREAVEVSRSRTLNPEFRGYLFWGPVAAAITATELLGVGWVQKQLDVTIPWPTISTTVGHLQQRWNVVAALVVGIIAAIAFTAVAYRSPDEKTANGRTMPKRKPELTKTPFYSWQLGVFPAILVGLIAAAATDNKLAIGYAMYGAFAVYGVIVPSLLVRWASKEVNFPTLFFTFAKLRLRYPWVTATFVALLAVLVFHLALYPWPTIPNK